MLKLPIRYLEVRRAHTGELQRPTLPAVAYLATMGELEARIEFVSPGYSGECITLHFRTLLAAAGPLGARCLVVGGCLVQPGMQYADAGAILVLDRDYAADLWHLKNSGAAKGRPAAGQPGGPVQAATHNVWKEQRQMQRHCDITPLVCGTHLLEPPHLIFIAGLKRCGDRDPDPQPLVIVHEPPCHIDRLGRFVDP